MRKHLRTALPDLDGGFPVRVHFVPAHALVNRGPAAAASFRATLARLLLPAVGSWEVDRFALRGRHFVVLAGRHVFVFEVAQVPHLAVDFDLRFPLLVPAVPVHPLVPCGYSLHDLNV